MLLCAFFACFTSATAQDIVSFRVSTSVPGPLFTVDGEVYGRPATFLWPRGSKHTVSIIARSMSAQGGNPACPADASTATQYTPDCRTRYTFGGWETNGSTAAGSAWTQSITADGSISSLVAQFSASHLISVSQFDGPFGGPTSGCMQKANRPFNTPAIGESIGIVLFGGQCFDYSGSLWMGAGETTLGVIPMAGYVYDGASYNGQSLGTTSKVTITGSATLHVRFVPAKRVRFFTDPPGLRVRIDRAELTTGDPSALNELPPFPGLFDFVPGSRHVIGAPSPQLSGGKNWVFAEWSNGLKQDAVYTAGTETNSADVLTARFIQGVTATFLTEPRGLRLNIDGRENWPNYGFVWGIGSTHTFSAPAEQLDLAGRRWRLKGWKHMAETSGQITIDGASIDSGGLQFTAVYESVPRLEIQSSLSSIRVDVNGVPCATPCKVDQPEGTEIRVSAPRLVPIDDASRLEFAGWTDRVASADRTVKLTSDLMLRANYSRTNRLLITADPPASADIVLTPASKDGFYDANAAVTVTAEPRPGFKFRRWEGDLPSSWHQGVLGMSGPRSAVAHLDRHPWLPEASGTPAPGPTPSGAVAPGSLIRMSGASLATVEETGPRNPLAQTLGGIVLTVGDRLLSLVSIAPDAVVALLPSDLATGEARLTYRSLTGQEVSTVFQVALNAPALFADSVRHEDGSAVTPDSPARPGEYLTVSGTGFGPLLLPVVDGFQTPASPANPVADPVSIGIGGVTITPESCIAEPNSTGRIVTRFRIPDEVVEPVADLIVSVGGAVSNTVPVPVTKP